MLSGVGTAALTCMVVCYALEARSPWFVFAGGLACRWACAYGWLGGTWPLGIVEGVWGLLALGRWGGGRCRRAHWLQAMSSVEWWAAKLEVSISGGKHMMKVGLVLHTWALREAEEPHYTALRAAAQWAERATSSGGARMPPPHPCWR